MVKQMSNTDYVRLAIAETERKIAMNESTSLNSFDYRPDDAVTQMKRNREGLNNRLSHFSESVRISLLSECIYKFYKEALNIGTKTYQNEALIRSTISNFIQENGSASLLSSFKTKSYVLSEMNRLVNKHHKVIIESVDKSNGDSFVIDPNFKDEFFKDLSELNSDEAIIVIQSRVADAMEEFVQTNADNKIQIQTILQDTQEKINASKSEDVKESYQRMAKQKINEVNTKTPKNVFGSMVQLSSESVLKNEDMRQQYLTEDNKINFDSIVEKCEVLYTFLETINTLGIIEINEDYIKDLLDSMK